MCSASRTHVFILGARGATDLLRNEQYTEGSSSLGYLSVLTLCCYRNMWMSQWQTVSLQGDFGTQKEAAWAISNLTISGRKDQVSWASGPVTEMFFQFVYLFLSTLFVTLYNIPSCQYVTAEHLFQKQHYSCYRGTKLANVGLFTCTEDCHTCNRTPAVCCNQVWMWCVCVFV